MAAAITLPALGSQNREWLLPEKVYIEVSKLFK